MTEALAVYQIGSLAQADSDETLITLWLHGRPATTSRCYTADIRRFLDCTAKPLHSITLGDVQRYADTLDCLAPASKRRLLSSVKSLLAFGHRLGYLAFDVGRAVRLPALKQTLGERILPEAAVHKMFALETHPRNHALLRLLYAAGLRVSEACALQWRDLQPRDEAGQVVVYGKGGKTRVVLLPRSIWEELIQLRGDGGDEAPVFRSRKAKPLSPRQAERIVQAAAHRAGQMLGVSPHWLRHAHASHALDRNAPVHLVQQTLGHASLATTSRYVHARPSDSSSRYLAV